MLAQGRLPDWAKPVLVIRDNTVLDPPEAGRLVVDDYAYFLVPLKKVQRLDQLFTPSPEAERDRQASGEFQLDGSAPLGAVCAMYGFALPEGESAGETISEFFVARFEARPQIGDHMALGPATLVARRTENGKVTLAGLLIDDADLPKPPPPDWRARVKRLFR